jgi:hypothetical protein
LEPAQDGDGVECPSWVKSRVFVAAKRCELSLEQRTLLGGTGKLEKCVCHLPPIPTRKGMQMERPHPVICPTGGFLIRVSSLIFKKIPLRR